MGRIVTVNVGQPRQIAVRRGRPFMSAIDKRPVEGRVRAGLRGMEGDAHVYRRADGGVDSAVYAYAVEDIAWWAGELGRDLSPGVFGENLTTEGIDVTGAVVGERWRVGEDVVLEVSQPRIACSKLGIVFGDGKMVRRFGHASRPGAYLRVVVEGTIGAGDAVEVLERPDHGVTVDLVSRAILLDPSLRPAAAAAPALADEMHELLS